MSTLQWMKMHWDHWNGMIHYTETMPCLFGEDFVHGNASRNGMNNVNRNWGNKRTNNDVTVWISHSISIAHDFLAHTIKSANMHKTFKRLMMVFHFRLYYPNGPPNNK